MDPREVALALIAELAALEPDQLAPNQNLVGDLGFDSVRALELIVELEDRLRLEVGEEEVGRLHTVGDILAFVDRAGAAPA